jgi:hypothetical protein
MNIFDYPSTKILNFQFWILMKRKNKGAFLSQLKTYEPKAIIFMFHQKTLTKLDLPSQQNAFYECNFASTSIKILITSIKTVREA